MAVQSLFFERHIFKPSLFKIIVYALHYLKIKLLWAKQWTNYVNIFDREFKFCYNFNGLKNPQCSNETLKAAVHSYIVYTYIFKTFDAKASLWKLLWTLENLVDKHSWETKFEVWIHISKTLFLLFLMFLRKLFFIKLYYNQHV